MYLLDTNACVSHLRSASSRLSRRIERSAVDEIVICSVVRAELMFGARRSRDAARNIVQVAEFCRLLVSLPFDDKAADSYATVRTALAISGTPIGPNDLMIAAIAMANGLTLVTHNTSEFTRVQGLSIEDWQ